MAPAFRSPARSLERGDPVEPSGKGSADARGKATLARQGDGFVLSAPRAIPGWEPRRFRRPALLVEGGRYYVTALRISGRAAEYDLSPWPEDAIDEAVGEIVLDETFLRSLEAAARDEVRERRREGVRFVMKPFIGLLPSAMKLRMHERGGVHPTEATRLSVFLEVVVALSLYVLHGITSITGVMESDLLWAFIAVVAVDAFVRYHQILGDDFSPPGFYEWIIPRRGK